MLKSDAPAMPAVSYSYMPLRHDLFKELGKGKWRVFRRQTGATGVVMFISRTCTRRLLGVDMSGIRNFPEAELELPSVPARPVPSKPQVVKVDDDAELAELAAWVNG